ncbi:LysR family transcriptional regulator [Cupriavidus basilensis]
MLAPRRRCHHRATAGDVLAALYSAASQLQGRQIPQMDWSDIKVFLAIARAGTLGGAARMTGQTQPTMGRRLKALEEAVGHALFQRTSEGFVLTDEGAGVFAHAERIEGGGHCL